MEILGLDGEPDPLELRELQKAFRSQARQLHPDSGGNAEAIGLDEGHDFDFGNLCNHLIIKKIYGKMISYAYGLWC